MLRILQVRALTVLAAVSFVIGAALSFSASAENDHQFKQAIEWKKSTFRRLEQNLSVPVEKRLIAMPEDMLQEVIKYERSIGIRSATSYTTRAANTKEQILFRDYLELLPPAHRRIFASKVVAILLVDNFGGAGTSNWVVNDEDEIYYLLILNPALFERTLDDWLTFKSNSSFLQSRLDPRVQVVTGTKYQALLYAMLHEGTHLVDLEIGLTPFIEPFHQKFSGRNLLTTPFVKDTWQNNTQPIPAYDIDNRSMLNVYGIFADRSLVAGAELSKMFRQLAQTPFVSFYSATSWNEHVADFVTYHHIEAYLNGEVKLMLEIDGEVVDEHRPLSSSVTGSLVSSIELIYL